MRRAGDPNRYVVGDGSWISEFELTVRAAMDREESKKTADRMKDIRYSEARDGKPRNGICRGYGYSYDKSTKQLSIAVSEAETLRECADRVLAGESVYSVAGDLNRRGIPTVSDVGWSTSVLRNILRSRASPGSELISARS
jgi:hypothetical protein